MLKKVLFCFFLTKKEAAKNFLEKGKEAGKQGMGSYEVTPSMLWFLLYR